jgi:hypothetical protein
MALRSGDCVRFGQSIFYYVANDTLRELLGFAPPGDAALQV